MLRNSSDTSTYVLLVSYQRVQYYHPVIVNKLNYWYVGMYPDYTRITVTTDVIIAQ